jgi:hypothetical protein
MLIFLKLAARQSCPVLSLKFATASFLGLPSYSAQILFISLHFFVAASSFVSCCTKDGLNFVRLYFLNYTRYVNDLHNI